MASLLEISELAFRQVYPNPTDETPISLQEFISSAKLEYSYQFLLWYWKEKATEGTFDMPAELSTEVELPVVNNEMDISDLDIMSRLPNSLWLQNIGGLTCECKYVKSNINQTQLLCDDDSMPDIYKTYLIIGNKIKFPKGTHTTPLSIIYANSGKQIGEDIEVMPEIGALVRNKLVDMYAGRIGMADKTNNTNSNT